jgi:hypothetical protein
VSADKTPRPQRITVTLRDRSSHVLIEGVDYDIEETPTGWSVQWRGEGIERSNEWQMISVQE